jgi:hypothetical protein
MRGPLWVRTWDWSSSKSTPPGSVTHFSGSGSAGPVRMRVQRAATGANREYEQPRQRRHELVTGWAQHDQSGKIMSFVHPLATSPDDHGHGPLTCSASRVLVRR